MKGQVLGLDSFEFSTDLIVQESGHSATKVMSQKAVTEYVESLSFGASNTLGLPVVDGETVYNGSPQSPTIIGYFEDYMDIGGTLSATEAGKYSLTLVPKPGNAWEDGSRRVIELEWEIKKAPGVCALSQIALSIVKNSSGSVTVTREENAQISVESSDSTVASASASGNVVTILSAKRGTTTITVSVGETANYTATSATISVSVLEPVAVPTQVGAPTFNGAAQSPTWDGYNTANMTISGNTSGVNAGRYTVIFTLAELRCWSDGTTTPKQVEWTVAKATGTLDISSSSILMLNTNETRTFTAACNTGGTLSVASSDTSKVTASISGNTITVTSKGYGSANVTVSVSDTTNYTTPQAKVCAVSVAQKTSLTPAQIKEVIESGQAASVFAVGDLFPIKFDGKMSDGLTLNNQTFYAAIIGINHNPDIEGNNRVHFKAPYDSTGKQLAWCDSGYNTNKASGVWFNMNNNNYSGGGYDKCDFKKNVAPLIEAAMEQGWRNIIRSCTKYSDNNNIAAGQAVTDTAANVTATQEKIWPLDEFEYHGARSYANSASKNYQKQYQYYINGNQKIHYRHDNPSAAVRVWCRGVSVGYHYNFCFVDTNGTAYSTNATNSLGVAVGFTV